MLRVQKWHGIGSVGLRMKETSGWEGWRNGTKLSSWNIHWISLSKLVLYGWYELRTTCWGAKASRQQEPLQDCGGTRILVCRSKVETKLIHVGQCKIEESMLQSIIWEMKSRVIVWGKLKRKNSFSIDLCVVLGGSQPLFYTTLYPNDFDLV